jgi:small subunit ribosomal protein S6
VSPPSFADRAFPGSKGSAPGNAMIVKRKGWPMALYEHIYLARQDISAQQVETLTAQFKSVLESFGGKVEKVEYWGVKSLAYRIKKNRKAHFSFLNIDAPPAALTEMERQMGINEDIIRFMTIRVEALEQGQSAMMRKRDDDDRGDRDRPDRGDRGRGPRPERSERGPRRPRDESVANEEASF